MPLGGVAHRVHRVIVVADFCGSPWIPSDGWIPTDPQLYVDLANSCFVEFREDCRAILDFLPDEFSEEDLNRWVPWLRTRHREVSKPKQRLHEAVRRFEQQGLVHQRGTGVWEKRRTPTAEVPIDLGLAQGDETDRNELADILQMDGPTALQRGIFKPASGPFEDQLLLFHDPHENPYGDVVGSEEIRYIGQGQTGDQKLKGFNRYLAEHLKRGYQVHFFEKADREGTLHYRGEVVCEDVNRVYRPGEGRSVLEYKLIQAQPLSPDEHWEPTEYYAEAQQTIQNVDRQPGLVERPEKVTVAQRLVRNVAFRDILLDAYEKRCAVCGVPLAVDDLTELEAAHIVAVSEQGPDDPRNGLSLCVRHHWAFDHGVFTLNDELEIRSFLDGPDPHDELEDGAEIEVPDDPARRPHPFYLEHHREKWVQAMG